jgi:hypothetical protein
VQDAQIVASKPSLSAIGAYFCDRARDMVNNPALLALLERLSSLIHDG